MIKYFEAFAGIGAFRSAFEKVGGFECVGWCEIDRFAQKAYRTLYDTKGEVFYEDITKIDYGNMPDFDLLVGGRAANRSVSRGADSLLRTIEETCFLTISKSLKPSAPVTLSLKTYPTCLVYRRGNVSESSLKRFLNWGIVCAGACLTLPDSEYRSQEEGCSLSDILETNVPQKYWLSEEMMRKIAKKENLNS